MTRKLRTLLAIGLVEACIAGLWIYLEALAREHPERVSPDFHQTVGSTLGMAMGALLGLGVVMILIASRNDRARER